VVVASAVNGWAQGLAAAWTFDSDPFGAGRQVQRTDTLVIGTDGSLAFMLTVDDGSFSNVEHRLYWLSPTGVLLWDSGFSANNRIPLAIRAGHLVYLEAGKMLHSVKRNGSGVFEDTTIATYASSDTTFTIEQGRAPGVLYLAETAADKASFTIHAYRLDSGNTVDLAEMFAGADGGDFTLFFPSAVGQLYQIERSLDLINWDPVGDPIVGSDSLQQYTDTGVSETFYYRVREL